MTISATDRVRVIQPGQTYVGKQGFAYGAGASEETVGAERICMNVLPMPPEARAKVHYHRGIETIAYLLEGECTVYYGATLKQRAAVRAGDQIFIPADVPHAPCNESGAPCTWLKHQLLTPEYAYLTDLKHHRAGGEWKDLRNAKAKSALKTLARVAPV